MKNKFFLFVLFIFAPVEITFCQITDVPTLIEASKSYYRSLSVFTTRFEILSKTSLSFDTVSKTYIGYVDNNTEKKLFVAQKSGMLINGANEYIVVFANNSFEKVRNRDKKYNIYHQKYIFYPFVGNDFFDILMKEKLSFNETDTSYLLASSTYKYEFRRTNYSVRSITKVTYDELTKGISYEKTIFGQCLENDPDATVSIERAISIVSFENNGRKADENSKANRPNFFDRSILNDISFKVMNDNRLDVSNKMIFLDFFYKDCYPCVKSYPEVEKLFAERPTDFMVIGVDHKLSDTINIDKYLQKYNINYPVIIGQTALEMAKRLKVEVWPTFVIIDSTGIILEYETGFSETFFRKIKRSYIKK